MIHKIGFDCVYIAQYLDNLPIYPVHILGPQDDFKSILLIVFWLFQINHKHRLNIKSLKCLEDVAGGLI